MNYMLRLVKSRSYTVLISADITHVLFVITNQILCNNHATSNV